MIATWALLVELYLIALALASIALHLVLLALEAAARAVVAWYRVRRQA